MPNDKDKPEKGSNELHHEKADRPKPNVPGPHSKIPKLDKDGLLIYEDDDE